MWPFQKKPSNLIGLIAKADKDLDAQLNDFKKDLRTLYPKVDIRSARPRLAGLLDTLEGLIKELCQPSLENGPAEFLPQAPADFTSVGSYPCAVDEHGLAVPSAYGLISGWQSIVKSHSRHFQKRLDQLGKLHDSLGGPAASDANGVFDRRLKMIRNACNGLIGAVDGDLHEHGV
jgi:hypothetical protein